MAAKVEITSGKWRGLRVLSDDLGKFRMMAIDQRDSMRRMLSKVLNRPEKEIAYADLANVKRSITKVLAPYSTATLTDPVYGYPLSAPYIPRQVGLLLAAEETGYEKSGADGRERVSRLIQGWSVEKAKRAGANAVKLLI